MGFMKKYAVFYTGYPRQSKSFLRTEKSITSYMEAKTSSIYKYIKIYKSGRSYGRFMEFGKMAFGKKICAPRQSLDG
jgi:hypothetical protein